MGAKRRVSEAEEAAFTEKANATMSSKGITKLRLLNSSSSDDMKFYDSLLNNKKRYRIHESKTTWDKEKGVTLGITIAVWYTDLFPSMSLE